jgi:beta propeller repeat protein
VFVLAMPGFLILLFVSPGRANPGDEYVFGADSAVTLTIPGNQHRPAISSNYAVWEDKRFNDHDDLETRIVFKDLTPPPPGQSEPQEQTLVDGTAEQVPDISGNLVVWQRHVSVNGAAKFEIHYMYLGNGCPGAAGCDQALPVDFFPGSPRPKVSGNRIVWAENRYGTDDVHMYDLSTATETIVAEGSCNQSFPAIDGDWVTWIENGDYYLGTPRVNDLHAKNVVTGEVRRITNDGSAIIQFHPAISGSKIVWNIQGSKNRAFIHDLATSQTQNITGSDYASEIRIDGNVVIWEKYATGQIMMHDLSSGVTQQVSRTTSYAFYPDVSAGRIVWEDNRSGLWAIYQNRAGDTEQSLAERYAPHLYLHHEEYFQPRKVDIMLAGEGTRLMQRNNGESFALAQWPELSLASLGKYSTAGDEPGDPHEGKYIDLSGNVALAWATPGERLLRREFVNSYKDLAQRPEYPETVYARLARSPDGQRFALQYWIPYYFNNFGNYHEGDWEMVQIDLDASFRPLGAAFSQHADSVKRSWEYVDHRETHPVCFVGRGSHANYFAPGRYRVPVDNFFDQTDYAEAFEPVHEPVVEVLPDVGSADIGDLAGGEFGWLAYRGAWGEYAGVSWLDSPQGPAAAPEHSGIWDDPFSFYDGLPEDGAPPENEEPHADIYGSVASPVDIHLYDADGNHVGRNGAGGIDRQIPGADYLEAPGLHRKTIIVHGGDRTAGFWFVLEGTGEGTFDFTVGSPDRESNTSDTLDYLSVPVTGSTRAELGLGRDSSHLLQIDRDGDGEIDEGREPDGFFRHDLDLTPPAPVSDLHLAEAHQSGSAALIFSAPGDDENSGAAQYYDLRYSRSHITEDTWKDAEPVETSTPRPGGSSESLTVTGLDAGATYYFALKSMDEVLLTSELSNVAQATTTAPQLTWSGGRAYWASWPDYLERQLSVDYQLSNSGTGEAIDTAIQASICAPVSVYAANPLPLTGGSLMPGASAVVTLKYHVPVGVHSFRANTYASCGDDAGRLHWFPERLP